MNKIALTALLTGVPQLLTLFSLTGLVCVGDVKEESRHFDQSTVRQGRGRLKMFLNLKCIFAPFAFVLFYYLHNYLKYKTLLFTIHSVVFK